MKKNFTKDTKRAEEFFTEKVSFCESPFTLNEKIKNNLDEINIIDVRKYEDYIEEHIPYAVHIPYDSLNEHLNMLHKDKINIVYCYNTYCKLAAKAAIIMAHEGFPVMDLSGGFNTWKKLGYDVVRTDGHN